MADVLTKEQRSYCMSRIRGSNTQAEVRFRRYLWKKGIKGYRIRSRVLGKPDLYFSKQKIAVFIDGCFWHKCPRCYKKPKSNVKFWNKKIEQNRKRDLMVNGMLKKKRIKAIRFWEHQLKDNMDKCFKKLQSVL